MAVYFLNFLVKVKTILLMLEVLLISVACVCMSIFTIELDSGCVKNHSCKFFSFSPVRCNPWGSGFCHWTSEFQPEAFCFWVLGVVVFMVVVFPSARWVREGMIWEQRGKSNPFLFIKSSSYLLLLHLPLLLVPLPLFLPLLLRYTYYCCFLSSLLGCNLHQDRGCICLIHCIFLSAWHVVDNNIYWLTARLLA